jgi:integrase
MKSKLKYVQAWVDKKSGAVYLYFRRPGLKRVPLPGPLWSREFMAAYQEALDQPFAQMQIGIGRSKPGSVAATVAAYFLSTQFAELAPSTRTARRCILQRFRDDHGEKPIGAMPPKFIALMLSSMKPHAARNYFKAIRALCQFAVSVEMIGSDPTQGIKRPKAKTEHRRPWTDSEVEQYERAHPVGSKARLALALGLYTVQRLGDVIRMGRQHIHNGELTVRQNKTGASLVLPVLPQLQAIIDATPGEHLTLLVKKTGRPYCGTEFSGQFREWCDEAGLPKGCTFHGLRATGCTRRADAGCSLHEIAAWSGHKTLKEVERYTKSANQKRLAVQAMARSANK